MENKKMSITELYSDETENKITESIPVKSKDRMIELIESFEQKNEIIKEKKPVVNEEKLQKEKERLKEVARIDEANPMNYWTGNVPTVMGVGQTVNTMFDPKNRPAGTSVNTAFSNSSYNPNSNKPYNPNYTYLQPAEALRLAISRVLNSGAPVNGLGFYEEINKELNILGFSAKSPLDIKQCILKMIKD